MDLEGALQTLGIGSAHDRDAIQAAFLAKVKDAKDDEKFEDRLKELNIARDILIAEAAKPNALAVRNRATDLAEYELDARILATRAEAKTELSDSLSHLGRRNRVGLDRARDWAGILGALSAGALFLRDNIEGLLGNYLGPAGGAALLITIICTSIASFHFHRMSKLSAERIEGANRVLTRQRVVDQVLHQVFGDESEVDGDMFPHKITWEIQSATGMSYAWRRRFKKKIKSAFSTAFSGSNFFDDEFVEDYIDFMIKHGFLGTNIRGNFIRQMGSEE